MLLGATSASLPSQPSSSGLSVGDVLPEMKSLDAEGRASTTESAQRYRLIHFWAAYDATSRAANVVWDHYFAGKAQTAIDYQAISLDTDDAVWSQTISLDQVDQEDQRYIAPTERSRYMASAGLLDGLHTYLVDDHGVVVAVDPTPSELANYRLNSNYWQEPRPGDPWSWLLLFVYVAGECPSLMLGYSVRSLPSMSTFRQPSRRKRF